MAIDLDVSYFTSDNSNFDDFSDSETAKLITLPDVEEPLLKSPKEHQQDPDYFPLVNSSTLNVSEESQGNVFIDMQHKMSSTSNYIQQTSSLSMNTVHTNNLLPVGKTNWANSTCSSPPEKPKTPNTKDVDDDVLIQALFLCERNYRPSEFFQHQSPQPSTSQNIPNNSRDTVDKYDKLDYYLQIASGNNKPTTPQLTANRSYPNVMKDYAAENPFAKIDIPKLAGGSSKPSRREFRKTVVKNRFNIARVNVFHQRYLIKHRSDRKQRELYSSFTNSLQLPRSGAGHKRTLSANSSTISGKEPNKVRKVIGTNFPKTSCRNHNGKKAFDTENCPLPSKPEEKNVSGDVKHFLSTSRNVKHTQWQHMRNVCLTIPTSTSGTAKKSSITYPMMCNPYVKIDPDFKPASVQGKLFIYVIQLLSID